MRYLKTDYKRMVLSFIWLAFGFLLFLFIFFCIAGISTAHAGMDFEELRKKTKLIDPSQVWPTESELEELIRKLRREIKEKKPFRNTVAKINNQIVFYVYADKLSQEYLAWIKRNKGMSEDEKQRMLDKVKETIKRMKDEKSEHLHALKASAPVYDFYENAQSVLNDIITHKDYPDKLDSDLYKVEGLVRRFHEASFLAQQMVTRVEITDLWKAAEENDYDTAEQVSFHVDLRVNHNMGASVQVGSWPVDGSVSK